MLNKARQHGPAWKRRPQSHNPLLIQTREPCSWKLLMYLLWRSATAISGVLARLIADFGRTLSSGRGPAGGQSAVNAHFSPALVTSVHQHNPKTWIWSLATLLNVWILLSMQGFLTKLFHSLFSEPQVTTWPSDSVSFCRTSVLQRTGALYQHQCHPGQAQPEWLE